MKKIIILSFAILAIATVSYSQAEVALGIKGGLNFANIDVSSSSAAYNSKTGYHAGAFLLIKLSKIGIQPEIIFRITFLWTVFDIVNRIIQSFYLSVADKF